MATLDEILAYVTETPGNTNPAVLATLIGEDGGSGGDLHIVEFTYDDDLGKYHFSPDFDTIYQWMEEGSCIGACYGYDTPYYYNIDWSSGNGFNAFYCVGEYLETISFGEDPELAAQGICDGDSSYDIKEFVMIRVNVVNNSSKSVMIDGELINKNASKNIYIEFPRVQYPNTYIGISESDLVYSSSGTDEFDSIMKFWNDNAGLLYLEIDNYDGSYQITVTDGGGE